MHDDINARMVQRHENEQHFYGWFDDANQEEPTYSPPLGGPCILCGRNMMAFSGDIRTHSLMYAEGYGKRSYFYRTHRTCAEQDETGLAGDGPILDMIKRNGD